jgi:hypothetical protein
MSNDTLIDPNYVHALLVGVERYDAGDHLSLRGPATDVARVASWLVLRRVPEANIAVYLSKADQESSFHGVGAVAMPRTPCGVASFGLPTAANILNAFSRDISRRGGDLLIVYWAGHGIIKADQTRRLICSDSTDVELRSIELSSALTFCRSSLVSGFGRQIWIADASESK